jgi:hypothetical protein
MSLGSDSWIAALRNFRYSLGSKLGATVGARQSPAVEQSRALPLILRRSAERCHTLCVVWLRGLTTYRCVVSLRVRNSGPFTGHLARLGPREKMNGIEGPETRASDVIVRRSRPALLDCGKVRHDGDVAPARPLSRASSESLSVRDRPSRQTGESLCVLTTGSGTRLRSSVLGGSLRSTSS